MSSSRKIGSASACTLLLAATAAQAQSWQFGVGVGQTDPDLSSTLAELRAEIDFVESAGIPGVGATLSVDDSDTGFKLFGGRRFGEHFGFEFGYTDLGDATIAIGLTAEQDIPEVGIQQGEGIFLSETDSVAGLSVAAVGRIPFTDRLSLTGRIGLYAYEVEWDYLQIDTTGLFGNFTESDSDSDSETFYGLSLDIGISGGLGLSVFYDAYGSGGDVADLVGLGLHYNFGDRE